MPDLALAHPLGLYGGVHCHFEVESSTEATHLQLNPVELHLPPPLPTLWQAGLGSAGLAFQAGLPSEAVLVLLAEEGVECGGGGGGGGGRTGAAVLASPALSARGSGAVSSFPLGDGVSPGIGRSGQLSPPEAAANNASAAARVPTRSGRGIRASLPGEESIGSPALSIGVASKPHTDASPASKGLFGMLYTVSYKHPGKFIIAIAWLIE